MSRILPSPRWTSAKLDRWAMYSLVLLPVVAVSLLWPGPTAASDNLRCGSRIISLKAIAAQVAAVCGEPSYVDHWELEKTRYGQAYGQPYGQYEIDSEIWYYNFGANQLLRLLRFRNGRLTDIDTDGYGFNVPPDGRCDAGDIVLGESKYRLLLTCGDPVQRRGGSSLRPLHPSNGYEQNAQLLYEGAVTPIYREELTYNFGSGARLRTAILENGWVVDINDGDRGFDPR